VWAVSQTPGLRYGDEIQCEVALRRPEPPQNPGMFDWQDWLARQRIEWVATIDSNATVTVLARDRGKRLTAVALRLQERFERALRFGLESDPETAGLLCGIVLGLRTEIEPEMYDACQQTGVFHIFSVSGLHVMMVTWVVVAVLRIARVPRRWCAVAAIPLLVVYVWATGARPGAVRALAMACVWLGGWTLVRPSDLLSTLAAAALAILVWEPMQLFDGGFVMSFTSVAAIVIIAPWLLEKWKKFLAPDEFLPRRLVPQWRSLLEKPRLWFIQLVCCSCAAWVGLLPLMAVYFNLFAPVSLLANLLVVPAVSVTMALGMAAILAHPVWPWLTLTLNNANWLLLQLMTGAVRWLEGLPLGHWFVQEPPGWLTAAYYALGLLLLARAIPWRWRRWTVGVGAPVAAGVALFTAQPEEFAELTVLDIPNGVAAFVNLPGERDDFLIDGGGERELLPFLRSQGVDRLGGVVLTCKDKAHTAGLSNIVHELPLRQVVMSDMPSRSAAYWDWRAMINRRRVPVRALHAGARWNVQQLQLTALNPPGDSRAIRADDNSLVLLLEYGPTRVLWMSDAGATVERRLVAGGLNLRCPILIKASHNKEPSGTDELLDAVRPELVVQIANRWPVQRNPDFALRERVERRGARWLCTEETGAVTLHLTSRGYWVRTCHEAARWP
jgi:competence protein ComEC